MNSYMYDKISKNKKEKKDTKFTSIVIFIIMIALIIIGSFAWSFGFRYRFSHFLSKFSECTSYALKEDSLIAEMDEKLLRVTNDNMQGIFNYITINGYGKESKKTPDEKPIVLDYGNGAVIKLWSIPPDKYSQSSGLFIQYEDTYGDSYSYMNYKMTLETIITRYLLYNNVELTEDKTDTDELLISENDIKKVENKAEDKIENETEDEIQYEVNIVDDRISIQNMDWDAYQNIMNAEEYETLLEYLPVLKNEATFTWDIDSYEREQKVVNIEEFRDIFDKYEPDELWINSIAICDIDEDGIKELILYLHNGMGNFLILHKENEEFYGTDRCLRGFGDLSKNGVYSGSNGVEYNEYLKMKFQDGKFEESILGEMRGDNYYIGEVEVSSDAFWEWVHSIHLEEVIYYDAVRKE